MKARKKWVTYLKYWKIKNVNQEVYIQQNYLSKIKEESRYFQINKDEENLLLVDLLYNK